MLRWLWTTALNWADSLKARNFFCRPEYFEIELYEDIKSPPFQKSLENNHSHILDYKAVPPSSEEITSELPQELEQLIREEKRFYQDKEFSAGDEPQWPITSSRKEHKDNDVFIGRAGNPFGHSTKWHYR